MTRLIRTTNCECERCRRNLDSVFFWLEEHRKGLYWVCAVLLVAWCLWRVM